jgi:hypothetical protein
MSVIICAGKGVQKPNTKAEKPAEKSSPKKTPAKK